MTGPLFSQGQAACTDGGVCALKPVHPRPPAIHPFIMVAGDSADTLASVADEGFKESAEMTTTQQIKMLRNG